MLDITRAKMEMIKNNHNYPKKKSNRLFGVKGSSSLDRKDEAQSFIDYIDFLYKNNIYDYRYLLK